MLGCDSPVPDLAFFRFAVSTIFHLGKAVGDLGNTNLSRNGFQCTDKLPEGEEDDLAKVS
jgi:hypothetical protein